MNLSVFIDFLVPLVAFLVVQDNLDAVINSLGAGRAILDRWHGKLTLFITHDMVVFFRKNRFRMLCVQLFAVVFAIAMYGAAKGYCNDVHLPWYMLLALLPTMAEIFLVGFRQVAHDKLVREIPLWLAEFKSTPDDEPVDFDDETAVSERLAAVEQEIIKYGPRDRSPVPHMWGMVFSPFLSAVCIGIFAAWMGYYGTLEFRGLERHWAMIVALDAYFCYILAGVSYKLVIGVGRAVLLKVTDAVAPAVTAAVRTVATVLPTIDATNVEARIPGITGQIVRDFAALTEELENRPIAKLELVFVMNALLPDPRVLFIATVAALVIKADHGNQAAEGIDVAPARREHAKLLSPWLRGIMRFALVAFFVGTISRNTVLAVFQFFGAVLNPFLSLGYPEVPNPHFQHWILPVLWGLVIVGVFSRLSNEKRLPEIVRTVALVISVACGLVLLMNITRRSRFQLADDTFALVTACPTEREAILATRPHPAPVVFPLPLNPNLPPVPPPPAAAPPPTISPPVAVGTGSPSTARLARRSRRHHRSDDGDGTYLAADVSNDTGPVDGVQPCSAIDPEIRASMRIARACR